MQRRRRPLLGSSAPGCGAVWLARLTGGQEVGGSNPLSPTKIAGQRGFAPSRRRLRLANPPAPITKCPPRISSIAGPRRSIERGEQQAPDRSPAGAGFVLGKRPLPQAARLAAERVQLPVLLELMLTEASRIRRWQFELALRTGGAASVAFLSMAGLAIRGCTSATREGDRVTFVVQLDRTPSDVWADEFRKAVRQDVALEGAAHTLDGADLEGDLVTIRVPGGPYQEEAVVAAYDTVHSLVNKANRRTDGDDLLAQIVKLLGEA
jgi:hypothetical protein